MSTVGLDFSKVFAGMVRGYMDGQTTKVWGKPNVPYATIQSVIEDPNATKKETVVEKIKWGQVMGTINFAASGLLYWFSDKLESGFWKGLLLFSSATSAVSGVTGWLVGTLCSNSTEKGMQEVLEKYITRRSPTEGGLETVALSKTNKRKLSDAVDKARTEGVVLNIYGPVGNGKTITGERFAAELMKRDVCKKAVFWDAQREVLSYGLVDSFRRMFGSLIPGETVDQRLERAVANAFAHYKKTGEHVVLVLNEAELLLEGEDSKDQVFGSKRNRSKVNPKDRPDLVQRFADIVDKVKRECKGVTVVLTANTLEDSFAFLERRFTTGGSIVIERPDSETRKELIEMTIADANKQGGNISPPTDTDLQEISNIGTINILDQMKKSYYYSNLNQWKSGYEYLDKYEDMMKNFHVLMGQEVRDAVKDAIKEKKDNPNKTMKAILEALLIERTQTAAGKMQTWEQEFKQRAGKSVSTPWGYLD